jgi:parallel beta-helix repeat protein
VKAIHLDNQVGGFLIEGNTFRNYSYGFDINGGGGHIIRQNRFGPCPNTTCTAVISMHAFNGGSTLPCPALVNYSQYQVHNTLPKVPWDGSLWRTRYPIFNRMMEGAFFCVPFANQITDNEYIGVSCADFPVALDRASPAELRLWGCTVANNTNTRVCPPI